MVVQEITNTLKTTARVDFDDEDFTLDISCTNKNEIAYIELWFADLINVAVQEEIKSTAKSSRHIELLAIAEANNLNHGELQL